MVSGRVTRRGGNHNGVLHGAGIRQILNHLSHIRTLLAHGHVNAVHRSVILVTGGLGSLVHAGLVDDRVDTDGGLTGRTVADDQLALATTNRDHRVDCQNTGLQRLIHGLTFHDAGGDFFHRIGRVTLDVAFAVDRLAKRIGHTAKQAFANWHLQQLAGGLDLLPLADAGEVAQHDGADLGFLEVQGQAGDSVAEVEHLVHHRPG